MAHFILLDLKRDGICRMKQTLDEPIHVCVCMCVCMIEDSVDKIIYLNKQSKVALKKKVLGML